MCYFTNGAALVRDRKYLKKYPNYVWHVKWEFRGTGFHVK